MARARMPFGRPGVGTTRRAALATAGLGVAALGLGGRRRPVGAQATPAAVPELVERWAAAWNAHDPAAMAALFADDGLYEDLAFGASFRGKDGVAEWVGITSSVIPDAAVEVVAAYQTDERATAEWVFTGSRTAAPGSQGPAPSGTFSVRAASVFEFDGGLIRRVSDYYNPADVQGLAGTPGGGDDPGAAATPA